MLRRTLLATTLALLTSPAFIGLLRAESPAATRVVFLGNSITKHGPKADIGWTGNWGMAASAEAKDYVHLVIQGLTPAGGAAPQVLVNNIADLERTYATVDVVAKVKAAMDFKPTLVILAIGENVPALKNAEEKDLFQKQVTLLLSTLKASGNNPKLVVRSCFWQNAAKDEALKAASEATGAVYVDISTLDKDPLNFANSEKERQIKHEGVGRHPGDKGMRAIAEAILAGVKR